MRSLQVLSVALAAIFFLTGISFGASVQMRMCVRVVAPPVTMDSAAFSANSFNSIPTQTFWTENNQPQATFTGQTPGLESRWEIQKTNLPEGVLVTYLTKD
jgi:hypothetical protein